MRLLFLRRLGLPCYVYALAMPASGESRNKCMKHYTLLAVMVLAMLVQPKYGGAAERLSTAYPASSSDSETVKVGAAEERFLSLLRTLSFGSTYADIKRVVPEVGGLRDLTGFGDYQAGLQAKLFGIPMSGEFNFHKETLVSHGFSAERLDKRTAMRIYRTVRDYLAGKAGKVSEDKSGTDAGPGWQSNWSVNGIEFGVYWDKKYNGYSVGWGAQAKVK
jgi:hypothetical protein